MTISERFIEIGRALRRGLHSATFMLALIALLISGCQKSESFGQPDDSGPAKAAAGTSDAKKPAPTADQVLAKMVRAYHEATSYADAAQSHLKIERPGHPGEKQEPVSVTFVRPKKLHIDCPNANLVMNGKRMWASVKSVENQVLDLDVPDHFQPDDLAAGRALGQGLAEGPADISIGLPIQLTLLLDDDALTALAPEGSAPALLADDAFDGHTCHRVQVQTPDGPKVYWIDAASSILRLVELPTEPLRKFLEADGSVEHLSLTVELLGARLNEPVADAAFEYEIPADAKRVKQLIGPPPPPPSELLGKPVPDFSFTGLDGAATSRTSLAGKVAVIQFWYTAYAAGPDIFQQLAVVSDKYKNSDRVAVVAVNFDPKEADDGRIRETAKLWGAKFPLARDTAGDAEKTFHLPQPYRPTLFVVGPDGTVQEHEVDVSEQMATELSETIDAVLAGKSTWEAAKARREKAVADYEREIQEPPAPVKTTVALPEAKILPRDEPQSLKLTKLWGTTDLKAPGNILVVEEAKHDPRLFVMDGPRTVVELGRDGKSVARHELQIPEQAVVTFLRKAVDKDGKRYFAGSASGQQQLFLFDADWKLLWAFPEADQGTHAGIGDVQFADLDGSGIPQLVVGYWKLVGVQGVSLAGKRLWTDRSMEYVLRLAVSGKDAQGQRRVLCTNGQGTLVPIDAKRHAGTAWSVADVSFGMVFSADLIGDEKDAICALADSRQSGAPLAIGLGPHGEQLWRYPLPPGLPTTVIEPIAAAAVASPQRHWLLAAPDGSIHFIAADGKLLDQFHYGAALTGLAGVRFGDEALLLVATARGLEGWRVEAK